MVYEHLDDDYDDSDDRDDEKPSKLDAISQLMGTASAVDMSAGRELAVIEPESDDPSERKKADFEMARTNIKNIITQGMDIVPDMMNTVRLSDSPKMYDSAANYFRMLSELNEKLVDINNKNLKSVGGISTESGESPIIGRQTNNNLFVGNMQEVMEMMRAANKKPD